MSHAEKATYISFSDSHTHTRARLRLIPIPVVAFEVMLLRSHSLGIICLRHVPKLDLELLPRLVDISLPAIVQQPVLANLQKGMSLRSRVGVVLHPILDPEVSVWRWCQLLSRHTLVPTNSQRVILRGRALQRPILWSIDVSSDGEPVIVTHVAIVQWQIGF
jgi:hypothetical protein